MSNGRVEKVTAGGAASTSSATQVGVGQDGRIVGGTRTGCHIASSQVRIGTADGAATAAATAQRTGAAASASSAVRWPSSAFLVGSSQVCCLRRIYGKYKR